MKKNNNISIPFSPPDISDEEINEVIKTMKSGWITTGPKTKELEERIANYIGVKRAVCLSSATACMELTLRVLGIGVGDEVITTAYTYTATAAVIAHVGAKIVLVDTEEDSFEMDYDQLEESITERTKAIIAVDIAGRMCNYDRIFEMVKAKEELFVAKNRLQQEIGRIVVIADSAHAFGAVQNEKLSGRIADFTCFSFHAVKNLTTGEGGAVVWRSDYGLNDEFLYSQFMLMSLHGQNKDALAKSKKASWEYDIVFPGYKFNMTDIMASIGLVQLSRYKELLCKRKAVIEHYNGGLRELNVKVLSHFGNSFASSGHLYMVNVIGINEEQRNKIIIEMAERGISTNVHYKPLPMLSAYKELGFNIENFPNSYQQYANEITLPLHTSLKVDEVQYIIDTFKEIVEKVQEGKL